MGEGKTGYDVAKYIEQASIKMDGFAYLDKIDWDIHSDNPVGRRNIEQAMRSADRFWGMDLV